MKNINNHLKSCSPANDVFTFSFNQAEVDEINKALEKKSWLEEVKGLMEEQERGFNPWQE